MNVIFDVGNVLVRWDPAAAFDGHLSDEAEIYAFFDEVNFDVWNAANDGGRPRHEAIAAIRDLHPDHADLMDGYFDRFAETIRDKIDGTWALADRLAAKGHRLFALTNFSADTWPVAQEVHPELATRFEDVLVSGREGLMKPDPAIFALLADRNGLAMAECLFIDDSEKNVRGARNAGWDAILFTGPDALEAALAERGLL